VKKCISSLDLKGEDINLDMDNVKELHSLYTSVEFNVLIEQGRP